MPAHVQLDVESLRTLLAVLDHGGMTRAADHLDMTQSAVSWKVKRLEERIGRPLLIRNGHDLRPTRDGRELLDDARSLVEIHDRAAARLLSSELTGTVRLGSNGEVNPAVMASLLGRFKRNHPGSTIEFIIDFSENLMKRVDKADLDVALLQVDDERLRPTDRLLWSDRLCWVASCEALEFGDPLPLITFGEHCFYKSLSEPDLISAGIEHTVAFSASTIAGVQAAITAGLGVGVLGSCYVGGDIVPWDGAADLPELPMVHQVARTVPGEPPAVAAALVDEIAGVLLDPLVSSGGTAGA